MRGEKTLDKYGERNETYVPGGNILIARAIRESPLWRWDSEHLRFWLYLLLSVNTSEKSFVIGPVTVGYGQVLKAFRIIAKENEYVSNRSVKQWSTARVKRMLERFKTAEMISTLGTELGTLITVRNFRRYQEFATYRAELGTELGTQSERSRNNNKQSIQSDLDNPTPEECSTDEGRAVLEFCNRVGCTWSLKTTADDWGACLHQQFPRVPILAELNAAGDYHEEEHSKGRKYKSPTATIRNWLKKAQATAEKNGTTSHANATVPFGSGAAVGY